MNKIKDLREAKGLSQDKLSQELGINLRTLQRWENGETAIRSKNINRIADYFNVTVPEVLGYEMPTPYTPREEKIQDLYIEIIKNKEYLTYNQFEQIYKSKINDDLFELLINFSNSPKEVQDNIRILLRYAVSSKYSDDFKKS
jgi:predicted transcriptional regulator